MMESQVLPQTVEEYARSYNHGDNINTRPRVPPQKSVESVWYLVGPFRLRML
jgi:hypothetical protein